MEIDVRDLQVNIREHLTQKTDVQPFPKKEIEPQAGEG
jgi:hypothetical protein